MSTLEELRRTMDRHADEVRDDATHVRASAVRRRGQQVRRQRRVGVGVAAVAAVAAVSVVAALPHGGSPAPADRQLLGMTAPATMTSLGYTYDFSRGITGDATRTTVKLAASDSARLLTWADRGTGTIRITTGDHRTVVSRGDFDDFLVIPPGFGGTWRIEGAHTAAAVYDVDADRLPEGSTEAGITYRSQVADRSLLVSDVGEAGQADLRGSVMLPAGRVGFSSFCTGGDKHTWVHAEVTDGSGSFGANCTAPVFDPGADQESVFRWDATGATDVRIWVTDGEHGPISTDPDLRLGYGFYSLPSTTVRVAGMEMDQQLEYDGHTWVLSGSAEGVVGKRTFRSRQESNSPILVVAAFAHTGGPVYTSLGGQPGAAFAGSGLGGSTVLGVQNLGTPGARLQIHGSLNPAARLGLAFYERTD